MTKAKTSKGYLKVLGILIIILGFILIASGIAVMAIPFDLAAVDNGLTSEIINAAEGNMDAARIALGITVLIVGLWELLEGWLFCRVSKHPKKFVLITIITIISVVGGIYTVIKAGFGDAATATGNIVSLTVNVLALLAIVNVRANA